MSLLPTWGRLGCPLTHQSPLIRLSQEKTSGWSPPPLMSSLFSFSKFLRDHPDYYPTMTNQTINKLLPTCSSKNKVHPPRFDKLKKLIVRICIEAKLYFQSQSMLTGRESFGKTVLHYVVVYHQQFSAQPK